MVYRKKKEKISKRYIVVVLFFIGAYLDIPLQISKSVELPSISNILLTMVLIPFIYKRYHKYDLNFLFFVFTIVLSSIIFAGNINYLGSLWIKIFQFILGIFTGITLLKVFAMCEIRKIEKIFFVISTVLLIGCFLEYVGLIRGLSDAFVNAVFKGGKYNIYDNADRDLELTGFLRPRFFTTEPSLLSIGFMISTTVFLIVTKNTFKFNLSFLYSVVFLAISGSPIVTLNIVIWVILFFKKSEGINAAKLVFVAVASLAIVLLPFSDFGTKMINKIQDRILNQSKEEGTSSNARLFVGYNLALPASASYNPIVGVGFAGRNILAEITGHRGVDPNDKVSMEFIEGANAFSRLFVYLGIVGGICFFYVFKVYLQKHKIKNLWILLIICSLFAQTFGTFETSRFWIYIFFIVGAFYLRSANTEKTITPINGNIHEKI